MLKRIFFAVTAILLAHAPMRCLAGGLSTKRSSLEGRELSRMRQNRELALYPRNCIGVRLDAVRSLAETAHYGLPDDHVRRDLLALEQLSDVVRWLGQRDITKDKIRDEIASAAAMASLNAAPLEPSDKIRISMAFEGALRIFNGSISRIAKDKVKKRIEEFAFNTESSPLVREAATKALYTMPR